MQGVGKQWTQEEKNFLRANHQVMTVRKMATELSRDYYQVHYKLRDLGLNLRREKPVWTQDNLDFILAQHDKLTVKEVCKKVGKSDAAVRAKMAAMDLQVKEMRAAWTKKEMWELFTLAEKYDVPEIAERMKRTRRAIHCMLRKSDARARSEVYSLARATRETGYTRNQLNRARGALDQVWRKQTYGKNSIHSITQYQLSQLCEWLRLDSTPCTSPTQSGCLSSLPSSSPPSSSTLPLTKVA